MIVVHDDSTIQVTWPPKFLLVTWWMSCIPRVSPRIHCCVTWLVSGHPAWNKRINLVTACILQKWNSSNCLIDACVRCYLIHFIWQYPNKLVFSPDGGSQIYLAQALKVLSKCLLRLRKLDKQRLVNSMRNDTPVPPWNIYLAKCFPCQHFHTRPQMNGFFCSHSTPRWNTPSCSKSTIFLALRLEWLLAWVPN